MTTLYAGLDIAKLNLQLHCAGRLHDLPNTATGHRRLIQLLAAWPGMHVICEATGGYERDLVAALHQASVPVSVLNPARVRHFARAQGQRAKTDPIDAAVLTAYGRALQPKPTAARTAQEQQLAELVRRRVQVLEILVAQRQQLERLTVPALRRQAQSLVRRLERDDASGRRTRSAAPRSRCALALPPRFEAHSRRDERSRESSIIDAETIPQHSTRRASHERQA